MLPFYANDDMHYGYILNLDHTITPVDDPDAFLDWLMNVYPLVRIVGYNLNRDFEVSTVYLPVAFPRLFTLHGKPVYELFETMVTTRSRESYRRWTTYEGAKKGHEKIVRDLLYKMHSKHN